MCSFSDMENFLLISWQNFYFSQDPGSLIYPFFSYSYFYWHLPFWLNKDFLFLFFIGRYSFQSVCFSYLFNCLFFFFAFFFLTIFFYRDNYLLWDALPLVPFSLRYSWTEFFYHKDNFLASNFISDDLDIFFPPKFHENLVLNSRNLLSFDFTFLNSDSLFNFYKDGSADYFCFSNFFYFHALQLSDFRYLHRDFFNFFPIIKFMTLRQMLSKEFTTEELLYMRNCFRFNDLTKSNNDFFLRAVHDWEWSREDVTNGHYRAKDFDLFLGRSGGELFNSQLIGKFFSSFLQEDICEDWEFFDQQDPLFFKKDFFPDFFNVSSFPNALFFLSFNRSFKGIYEMLYFNHKIRFPKRFLRLRSKFISESDMDIPLYEDFSSTKSVFWDF